MAIDIRSITLGTNTGTSATVSVVTSESPAATQVGDLVVVVHSNTYFTLAEMPTPTATGSPTLTAITNGTADGGTNSAHIKSYTYVANTGGAQTVSVTETGLADEEKALAAFVLSGADTTTRIDIAGNLFDGAAGLSHVLPSISPSSSDAYLIAHLMPAASFLGESWTPPGTMAERYDQTDGASSVTGATEQLSASGATGTRTFTSSAAVNAAGVLIAVKTGSAAAPTYAMLWPAVVAP